MGKAGHDPGFYRLREAIRNPAKDGRNRGKDWRLRSTLPSGLYELRRVVSSVAEVFVGKVGGLGAVMTEEDFAQYTLWSVQEGRRQEPLSLSKPKQGDAVRAVLQAAHASEPQTYTEWSFASEWADEDWCKTSLLEELVATNVVTLEDLKIAYQAVVERESD